MNNNSSFSPDMNGHQPVSSPDALPNLVDVAEDMAGREANDPVKIKYLVSALGEYASAGAILEGADGLLVAYIGQTLFLGDPVPAAIGYIRGHRANLDNVPAISDEDTAHSLKLLRNTWHIAAFGEEVIVQDSADTNRHPGMEDIHPEDGLL